MEMTEQQMKIQFNEKVFALQQYLDNYPFLKDGYNDAQKYEYVKANQYRNALRNGAIENRLRLKVNIANRIHEDLVKSDKMHLTTIQGSIALVDIDTGYEEATYMMADGADNLDKGIYKAMTMFIKSYVQTTFMISDDNDDDQPVHIVTNLDTPTELKFRKRLDYVFISPRVEKNVVSMDIDLDTMDKEKITDHAALILELK